MLSAKEAFIMETNSRKFKNIMCSLNRTYPNGSLRMVTEVEKI